MIDDGEGEAGNNGRHFKTVPKEFLDEIPYAKSGLDTADEEAELLNKDLTKQQIEQIDADGKKMYYELRHNWSHFLLFWISGLILFNIFLTITVGAEIMKFEDKKWYITAITVETFMQIFGMGYIAVKFLFSHK